MDFIGIGSEVACGDISIPVWFETFTELFVDYSLSGTYPRRLFFVSTGRSHLTLFLFHNFTLMQLENLNDFLNLRFIFQFNAIWYRRSMAALVMCWNLAESDVTVTPSVTCMDWLCWWYNRKADIVSPSTALAFVTKMCDKCEFTSPSAIQVKNQWKIIWN
jgi:hypothetical protein